MKSEVGGGGVRGGLGEVRMLASLPSPIASEASPRGGKRSRRRSASPSLFPLGWLARLGDTGSGTDYKKRKNALYFFIRHTFKFLLPILKPITRMNIKIDAEKSMQKMIIFCILSRKLTTNCFYVVVNATKRNKIKHKNHHSVKDVNFYMNVNVFILIGGGFVLPLDGAVW